MLEIEKQRGQTSLELYNSFLKIYKWKIHIFNLLNKGQGNENRHVLFPYKWKSMISHYFIDLINFPENYKEIFAELINFTSKKTGLHIGEIDSIFQSKKINFEESFEVPKYEIKQNKYLGTSKINLGKISLEVPSTTLDKIISRDNKFVNMILKYSILDTSSGYFWSLDPELYTLLSKTSLAPLECFSSPFNYNLNNFCSTFNEDAEILYSDKITCYGEFFNYIRNLNIPSRLILNPPYTDRIINNTAKEVINYFDRVEGAQMISVFPNWEPQGGIESLKEMEGSSFEVFEYGSFILFDYLTGKYFKPYGVSIILVVNIASDKKYSDEALSVISNQMRTAALKIQ